MSKSLMPLLAGVALLLLIPVASWSAETPGAKTTATGNPVPSAVHSTAGGA
jgi:hypothetical protein